MGPAILLQPFEPIEDYKTGYTVYIGGRLAITDVPVFATMTENSKESRWNKIKIKFVSGHGGFSEWQIREAVKNTRRVERVSGTELDDPGSYLVTYVESVAQALNVMRRIYVYLDTHYRY